MKQNTKFLWIYIAILFSFALILIVFAGLTKSSYRKEIQQKETESAGVKQSLVTLTDQNQKMNDNLKLIKTENENLKTENQKINSQKEILLNAIGGNKEETQKLVDAYLIYSSGDSQTAIKNLEGINSKQLTQAQLYIYNIIIGE